MIDGVKVVSLQQNPDEPEKCSVAGILWTLMAMTLNYVQPVLVGPKRQDII